MIKLKEIVNVEELETGKKLVQAKLIADESVEVEDIGTNGTNVIGLGHDYILDFGSSCFTTTMEYGVLNSAGNWRFQ